MVSYFILTGSTFKIVRFESHQKLEYVNAVKIFRINTKLKKASDLDSLELYVKTSWEWSKIENIQNLYSKFEFNWF